MVLHSFFVRRDAPVIAGAVALMVGLFSPTVWALPAFPGAEGHGAETRGGRGGRVIEVTNLEDSGTGSLRAACTASGPRIVVFRVSGTIALQNRITITSPFLTIAGQTAPGGGVQIRGAGLALNTNDVVVRGLRIRPGDLAEGPSPIIRDAIELYKENVIIDHCSLSWGIDENSSTWYPTVRNVTFQWNIISEGLRNSTHPKGVHSMGLLIGDGAKRVTVHHNLFAHNNERHPLVKAGTDVEVVNNVMYNWGELGTYFYWGTDAVNGDLRETTVASVIGNFYKAGADTNSARKPISMNTATAVEGSRIHVAGNVGPGRPTDSGDEWAIASIPAGYRSATPAATASGLERESATAAVDRVLGCAGATTPRDSVDARVVKSVRDGTGRIIDSQSQVGGWPMLATGQAPVDTDHDGMPDAWEMTRGLNPNDPADGARNAPSGYTFVEDYLNGLFTTCDLGGGSGKPDAGAAGSGARPDAAVTAGAMGSVDAGTTAGGGGSATNQPMAGRSGGSAGGSAGRAAGAGGGGTVAGRGGSSSDSTGGGAGGESSPTSTRGGCEMSPAGSRGGPGSGGLAALVMLMTWSQARRRGARGRRERRREPMP